MSREVKFTTDGKKVVVIGSLNSQEKIVQEIFIVDGSEIPSGEHFVVKSLHDKPAVSWKQQELDKLEVRYQLDRKRYENEIEQLRTQYNRQRDELYAKLQYTGLALKNANEKSFDVLVNYITGRTQWVVVDCYNEWRLVPIAEFNQMNGKDLRLVSLFGNDNGSFNYWIGAYSDYSGSKTRFTPFNDYDSAFAYFKELIIQGRINDTIITIAAKYSIELDAQKLADYKESQLKHFDDELKRREAELKATKKRLEEFKQKF